MQRDRLKQAGRADEDRRGTTRRGDQSPPVMRSPALRAAEQRRPAPASGTRRQQSVAGSTRRQPTNGRRYAAEGSLAQPLATRKRLPHGQRLQRWGGSLATGTGLLGRMSHLRASSMPMIEPKHTPLPDMSEEEQKKLAELEMRLPRVAGKIDSWLLVVVLALLCIGLVMVFSASSFWSAQYYHDASVIFQRQFIWVLIGLAVMIITMRIDYRKWRRLSLIGMLVTLPLLVIVLKFGTSAYGASRWLAFGSFFSFQPSELIKLVLALYIADWLARKGRQVSTFLYGLAPFVILIGLILGLVLLERDMGTAIIIAGLAVAMFFTAGANITQFLLALAGGGLIFLTQAFSGYRYFRLAGFVDPFSNVTSINLQLYQSLLGLGSGGWLGLGLGASRQKTGYLPLPYTDSIFAVIGEELGFIACAAIVALFLFLAFRGFRLARRTPDMYGALLATGITTWLVLQAIINIGATTGSIPYTGVPLPFISFGGSSLVVSLAAIGVLLNISRYIQEPEDPLLGRKRTITASFKRKL